MGIVKWSSWISSLARHLYFMVMMPSLCMDKSSKMTHFMPITTHDFVEGMARLFHDHLHKLHGLANVILNDGDTRFTSRFEMHCVVI